MAAFIVTYDLHRAGQNYQCLTDKLESYPTHWHVQQSVWIIATNQSAADIRDSLNGCLDNNDKLIVARLSGEAAWVGYSPKVSDWLKRHL